MWQRSQAHYCNLMSGLTAEDGACFSHCPRTFHLQLSTVEVLSSNASFIFFLACGICSVGSAFCSAYKLRGANISHCLRLCTLVTMSQSQALTDNLRGPTRDSGRIHTRVCHTAWQEYEKCGTGCHFCPFIFNLSDVFVHFEVLLCPEAPLGSCDPAKSWPVVSIVLSHVHPSCEHNISGLTVSGLR